MAVWLPWDPRWLYGCHGILGGCMGGRMVGGRLVALRAVSVSVQFPLLVLELFQGKL